MGWLAITATLKQEEKQEEITRLTEALKRAGGDVSAAASALGIPRCTFYRKIKALSIDLDVLRASNQIERSEVLLDQEPLSAAHSVVVGWRHGQHYEMAYEASLAVAKALRDGLLPRPDTQSCQVCGSRTDIRGHHDDYSKPLELQYLCAVCHRAWHSGCAAFWEIFASYRRNRRMREEMGVVSTTQTVSSADQTTGTQ